MATPSCLCRMPSAAESSRLMSASMGKVRSLRSGWLLRQARCTYSESIETPSTWASRSAKSRLRLPNSAISVGQTKVKSLGQKNTTFHLPAWSWSLRSLNSLPLSRLTTACSLYSGNLSPTVNIASLLPGGFRAADERQDGGKRRDAPRHRLYDFDRLGL